MGGTSTDGRFACWSRDCRSTPPWGDGTDGLAGGFEVEARYWVLRLHAALPPFSGVGVCGWSSPLHLTVWLGVVVWGCFLRTA